MIRELTTDTFNLPDTRVTVVDFWATWCHPCKILLPVLEEVVDEMSTEVDFYKINAEDEPDLAKRFGVVSLPTIIIFSGGKAVKWLTGTQTKAALIQAIKDAAS